VTTSTRSASFRGFAVPASFGSVTAPVAAHSAPRRRAAWKPAFCIAATSWPRAVKYARPFPNVLTHRIGSSFPVPPVAGSLHAVARTRAEGRVVIWW